MSRRALSLHDIVGMTVCGLLTMRCGGLGILIPDPCDVRGMIRALRGYGMHSFPGVDMLYKALLNEPGFDALDFSRLLQANGAGAAQRAVAKRWHDVTGVPITGGYGLAEASPCVAAWPERYCAFHRRSGAAAAVHAGMRSRRRGP